MENNTTIYVSCLLVSGQTIIAECVNEPDQNGFYTFINPFKPIMVNQKLVLSMMNPFSDSDTFLIHRSHIINIGELHFEYMQLYLDSVIRIQAEEIQKYDEMTSDAPLFDSMYVDSGTQTIQ